MMKKIFFFEVEAIFSFFFMYFFMNFFINPFYFFDKLSFLMVLLSLVFFFFLLICEKMISSFYTMLNMTSFIFFLMMLILILSFYFQNMLFFYMFFEMSVIPIFLYIISWGNNESKIFAGLYLLFFTFFSSLVFFAGMFYLFKEMGSLNFFLLIFVVGDFFMSKIFFFMMIVFFVKMPMFLFHIWLPLAHVESPMTGSMILAAIMLKLGGYGMFRMLMMFFEKFFFVKMYFFIWGIFGAILVGVICFSQVDLKKMVAFSSVSHMSVIMMSIFSMGFFGKLGSLMMMLSHGFVSSSMFFGLGVLYYRFFSRNLFFLSSLIFMIPLFGMWWFLVCIMNLGFPPFISFLSEFFIFLSMIEESSSFFLMGLLLVMVSSIYTLNLMMYLISGLKKHMNIVFEMILVEHLIFFVHFFVLFLSPFCIWLL